MLVICFFIKNAHMVTYFTGQSRIDAKLEELQQTQMQLNASFDITAKLKAFFGQTFVVKCGNNHIADSNVIATMAMDVAMLVRHGINVVIVHGAGPFVGELVQKLGAFDSVIDNYRVTNREVFEIMEMVLRGKICSEIVTEINKNGVKAVGLSGRDYNFITADKLRRVKKDEGSNVERILDLGMVGEANDIDLTVLQELFDYSSVPVISPIGISKLGQPYSLNADVLASFIATKLCADKLFLMSDVHGFKDRNGDALPSITADELHLLIKDEVLPAEIKQKAESSVFAVRNGVTMSHVINGNIEHSILHDILNINGVGTVVYSNHKKNGEAA